jgi:hypothetical protein
MASKKRQGQCRKNCENVCIIATQIKIRDTEVGPDKNIFK